MNAPTLLTLRIPAFDAAIRKAIDPGLRSRPVAVTSSRKTMGRLLAVCPEAKAAGLAEDMPYPEARAACPDAAFFTPDRELAARAIAKLMERALSFSPLAEPAGDGRILLDTRGTEKLWGDAGRVAELLQADIGDRLRLPAAAGLAAHRPWSLLASRAAGDGGVCRVEPGTENEFLGRVPVTWVDGVSAKTCARLVEMNIHAVGQLRQFGREEIRRQFGSNDGETLWNAIQPHVWDVRLAAADPRPDVAENTVRVEAAMAEATVAEDKVRLAVRTLAGQAAAVLRARDLGSGRLRLALLYADGVVKTAEARTGGFIRDEDVLMAMADRLLSKLFLRRVRVARLRLEAERLAEPQRQGTLFGAAPTPGSGRERTNRLLGTLDRIHGRYGGEALRAAALVTTPRAGTLLECVS